MLDEPLDGASDDVTEQVAVSYEVIGLEWIRRPSRVVAIACALVTIAGIETLVQGILVKRLPDGKLTVSAPVWRHPVTGDFHPAVKLPPEVSEAIAAELFTMMAQSPEAGRA